VRPPPAPARPDGPIACDPSAAWPSGTTTPGTGSTRRGTAAKTGGRARRCARWTAASSRRLDLPAGRVVYLAQEIDRDTARRTVAAVRHLPKARLGAVLSVVGALGSEPQRLIETDEPSPGELRKLLLALGMAASPHLIVMDEPTNHLDLPSIECLERALGDCPSALLLVSHDVRFLGRLTRLRWEIAPDEADPAGLRMRLQVRRPPAVH